MKYPILRADGTLRIFERATPLAMDELRVFCGRDFECIHLSNGLVAVVNHNERLKTKRVHPSVLALVGGGLVGTGEEGKGVH